MIGLLVFASLLTLIFSLLYYLSTSKFSYWEKKNVPYIKPLPFLGNYGNYIILREYPGQMIQKLCQKFIDQPYFGAFFGTEPVLVVNSPEVVKQVMTKDFYYFNGREITKHVENEKITNNVFFTGGDQWKVVRQNLTPLFSSSKMKNMYHLVEKCAIAFEDMLDYETGMSNIIEVRNVSARYTMDNISSCAFGVDANTMSPGDNNPFKIIAKDIFSPTNYRGLKLVLRSIWPAIFYGAGFRIFPESLDKFFYGMLKEVFQSRNYEPTARNDFVDLVLALKKENYITGDSLSNAKTGGNKKIQLKVDDELLVAQCAVFFAAGFDTSATTMSFTLYELAKNPEVQQRAAEEVDEFLRRHGNKLNYECVNELPYLEACMDETLRMYPVLGHITREVMDDYVFPSGLKLDVGVRVHIPVYHLHHNPEFFPEPEKYKPERFLPENKDNIIPYSYLPFGTGPRLCIGMRFAKMQTLTGLITFLKKYRFELADGMPETVTFEATTISIQPKGKGIMLKLTKREGWEDRKYVRSEQK